MVKKRIGHCEEAFIEGRLKMFSSSKKARKTSCDVILEKLLKHDEETIMDIAREYPQSLLQLATRHAMPQSEFYNAEKAYQYFTLLANKHYGDEIYIAAAIALANMEANGIYFNKNPSKAAARLRHLMTHTTWAYLHIIVVDNLQSLLNRYNRDPSVCFHTLCALHNIDEQVLRSFNEEDWNEFMELCENDLHGVIKVILARIRHLNGRVIPVRMPETIALEHLTRLMGEDRANNFLAKHPIFFDKRMVAKDCREVLMTHPHKGSFFGGDSHLLLEYLWQLYNDNYPVISISCDALLAVKKFSELPLYDIVDHHLMRCRQNQIIIKSLQCITPDKMDEFISVCRDESLQNTKYLLSQTSAEFQAACRSRICATHVGIVRGLQSNGYPKDNLFNAFSFDYRFKVVSLAFSENLARLFLKRPDKLKQKILNLAGKKQTLN